MLTSFLSRVESASSADNRIPSVPPIAAEPPRFVSCPPSEGLRGRKVLIPVGPSSMGCFHPFWPREGQARRGARFCLLSIPAGRAHFHSRPIAVGLSPKKTAPHPTIVSSFPQPNPFPRGCFHPCRSSEGQARRSARFCLLSIPAGRAHFHSRPIAVGLSPKKTASHPRTVSSLKQPSLSPRPPESQARRTSNSSVPSILSVSTGSLESPVGVASPTRNSYVH